MRQLLGLMQSPLQPEIRNQASNEIRHQYLSAAKARRVLGWTPLFTLDQGLQNTIQWYEQFFSQSAQ